MKPRGDSGIDNLLKYVTVISTLRGIMSGKPESQITTHEQFEKRGGAARSNAVNIAIGGLCLVGGVGMHLVGWTLASGHRFEMRGIFIGIPLCLVMALIPSIGIVSRFAYEDEKGQRVYPFPFKWAYLAVLTAGALLSFGLLVGFNYDVDPLATYAGLALAASGPVAAISGWMLAYNGIKNLKNPYGWRSPAEEEIQKPLALAAADLMRLMIEGEQAAAPPPVVVRAIPTRNNGRHSLTSTIEGNVGTGRAFMPDPEQHNLVFLGLLAAGRQTLAYRPLTADNPTLPGIEDDWEEPRTLNEETLAALLERGAEWGWWELPGPRRTARLLLNDWESLRDEAEYLWDNLTQGLLPLPDPFGGTYEIDPRIPHSRAA